VHVDRLRPHLNLGPESRTPNRGLGQSRLQEGFQMTKVSRSRKDSWPATSESPYRPFIDGFRGTEHIQPKTSVKHWQPNCVFVCLPRTLRRFTPPRLRPRPPRAGKSAQ